MWGLMQYVGCWKRKSGLIALTALLFKPCIYWVQWMLNGAWFESARKTWRSFCHACIDDHWIQWICGEETSFWSCLTLFYWLQWMLRSVNPVRILLIIVNASGCYGQFCWLQWTFMVLLQQNLLITVNVYNKHERCFCWLQWMLGGFLAAVWDWMFRSKRCYWL